MQKKELSELTTEELQLQLKKSKTENIIRAALIGAFIGVSFYSIYAKGFTFWTIFPLIFVFLLLSQKDRKKK